MRALLVRAALVGAAALAAGCQPRVVDYQVRVITSACVAPSPLEGVTHLRFRVTGDGITEPLIKSSAVTAAVQEIPEIPAGDNRVLEVRAYKGDPAEGGQVISVGSSLPFDVPDVVPDGAPPEEIAVFLRRVNAFTPPSTAEAPTSCSAMRGARAGHSATLMNDGRVLIAGGFELGPNRERNTVGTSELFDPATGTFKPGPDIGTFNQQGLFSPAQRQFHAATLLPTNGQVVLVGGEMRSNSSYFPVASALVYDPTVNTFAGFPLISARIRPGIATDVGGRLLIVGGSNASGQPVAQPEWYDPSKPWYKPSGGTPTPEQLERQNPRPLSISAPRVGMSVAAVQGGQFVAVAGGSNGTNLTDEILFFNFDGTTFSASAATIRLQQGRFGAGIAQFQDPSKLMIVGGYDSSTEPAGSLSTSEIISTGNAFNVSEGGVIAPRGDACVASLPDGRVVVIGGRETDLGGGAQSSKAVELVTPVTAGGAPSVIAMDPLKVGRYHHTCTALADGSVLVLGGVEEAATGAQVLQDAYIFTPAPLD